MSAVRNLQSTKKGGKKIHTSTAKGVRTQSHPLRRAISATCSMEVKNTEAHCLGTDMVHVS